MNENDQNQAKLPGAEAQQEAAQTRETKTGAAGTATASTELAEDDLEAVAGGIFKMGAHQTADL